ncbi:hypothetical protein HPB50_007929 [Hyalomma asiaticum]|uniref:Uncharacterized protein n=1 Tax=Hyalomma asiaticum TaxID=266040 RepID=A0ACB7S8A0_HYAAI|nr:hypothetical protein HPB50_007929 [Hyalomma asiaticum]
MTTSSRREEAKGQEQLHRPRRGDEDTTPTAQARLDDEGGPAPRKASWKQAVSSQAEEDHGSQNTKEHAPKHEKERRQAKVEPLRKDYEGPGKGEVRYTDAAKYKNAAVHAVSVVNEQGEEIAAASLRTTVTDYAGR